jgi:Fe-S cluster assembly protein SufD
LADILDALISQETAFRPIASGEPDWFYQLRRDAWEYFLTASPPDRTSNVWRYTDPADFHIAYPERLFNSLPVSPDIFPTELRQIDPEHSAFGYNTSDLKTYARMVPNLEYMGVIFKELHSAIRENRDLVEPYFGKLIGPDFGKFEALNQALWNTGLFLNIPSNVIIEKPIYIHRYPTDKYTIPRLLVVIGDNAQATIIDDYAGSSVDKGSIANSAVELFAGDSSNVRYVNIQRFGADINTYITVRSQVGQNTNIKSIYGSTGSLVTKVNAGTILNGRGANSQMYGVIFGDSKQHFDYHTMQHHKSNESFSNLNFKVVLKDKAKSAYTGLIRIEKDTVNCEAYQENRNLLLNPGTKAESIPELEILTDQVRCTHGATMGPIDPEQVFYLKSRGLDETNAVRMIVTGFMESLLAQVPEETTKILRDLIYAKLEDNPDGPGIR